MTLTVLLGILLFVVVMLIAMSVNVLLTFGICWAADCIWHIHTPFFPIFALLVISQIVLKVNSTKDR